MDWESTKARLVALAVQHDGRAADFGRLVELCPPATGERIRVCALADGSVRLEAGWFLCRTLEPGADDEHLAAVVTALMTGGAREFVVLEDGVLTGDGYLVEYAGGALAARREPHALQAVERIVPSWRPARGTADVEVGPATPEEIEQLLTGARSTYAQGLRAQRGLSRADAETKAATDIAALLPQGGATPGHLFLSARRAGLVLGGAWAAVRGPDRADSAWIYHLQVEPAARRRGIAAHLVRDLAAAVRTPGVTHLGLNVFGDNTGAMALYDRLGFTVSSQQMVLEL